MGTRHKRLNNVHELEKMFAGFSCIVYMRLRFLCFHFCAQVFKGIQNENVN